MLERAFKDALFPRMLFRSEVAVKDWPKNVGDNMIFTAPGLIAPNLRPLTPGSDPSPTTYSIEQWESQLQRYAQTIDVDMPTDMLAIASIFMRNAQQLGLSAAQSLNRNVRNRMYNAAEAGWTVCNGGITAATSLPVKRLNGFTRARNPTTSGASNVRYAPVSSTNPLAILVDIGGTLTARNVTAFTPDVAGDETGPGTLTIDSAATISDRGAVLAVDRSFAHHVGGGNRTDDITSTDIPRMSDVRTMVANFWQNNVPEHLADKRFHAHCDPISISKLFEDAEFQRLNTSLPDYYMYKQFAVGEILNCIFVRNTECPVISTVYPYDGTTFSQDDPFAGELYSTGASTGTPMHRMLFSGAEAIFEFYRNPADLISDAGLTGKVAEAQITNNGIEVSADRIQLIFRAPLNRLQDKVAISWQFIGDWPVRTDGAVGNAQRYKRLSTLIHGE